MISRLARESCIWPTMIYAFAQKISLLNEKKLDLQFNLHELFALVFFFFFFQVIVFFSYGDNNRFWFKFHIEVLVLSPISKTHAHTHCVAFCVEFSIIIVESKNVVKSMQGVLFHCKTLPY